MTDAPDLVRGFFVFGLLISFMRLQKFPSYKIFQYTRIIPTRKGFPYVE
ncbi:hypothetical protein VPHK45_0006 [Vibrio phage K45]